MTEEKKDEQLQLPSVPAPIEQLDTCEKCDPPECRCSGTLPGDEPCKCSCHDDAASESGIPAKAHTIYRYPIGIGAGTENIMIPNGALLLGLDRPATKNPCISALVDPSHEAMPTVIHIFQQGQAIFNRERLEYLGFYHLDSEAYYVFVQVD